MSNTPQVVDGEASESDSELEIGKTPDADISVSANIQAFVISGEASESDDEERLSTKKVPTLEQPPLIIPRHIQKYSDSLLHHRLWEVNVSMRRNIEVLGLHTMKIAFERMASLDKELLALQESVRVADNQVTLARARSRQMKEQMKSCHFHTALPNVKYQ